MPRGGKCDARNSSAHPREGEQLEISVSEHSETRRELMQKDMLRESIGVASTLSAKK